MNETMTGKRVSLNRLNVWRAGEQNWPTTGRLILATVCVTLLSTIGSAHASQITVNSTNTEYPTTGCGLREAIESVNTQTAVGGCQAGDGNNDTIVLVGQTYQATHSLTISAPVTLRGVGIGSTILRSNMATDSGFFWVYNGAGGQVHFEDLTVDRSSGQASPFVTGIYVYQGSLSLTRVRIAGHTWGGIISDDADLFIDDATIENNSSQHEGGGIQLNSHPFAITNAGIQMNNSSVVSNVSSGWGGGIYYSGLGNANLTNTTVSANKAQNGGGIAHDNGEYFNLIASTVANNTATGSGGGVYVTSPVAKVNLRESIVGQNTAGTSPDWAGAMVSMYNSLIGNTAGVMGPTDSGPGNLFDVAPNLDPVPRDLGGAFHTKVQRPFPGSPVIDRLSNFEGQDQRHVARPQFGGLDATKGDMGAFEASRLETETLAVAAKSSSVPHVITSGTQYSNAKGTNLQGTVSGGFVTYSTTASLTPGTYSVVVGFKKGNNEGRFQLAVAQSVGGTYSNVGGVQDCFASSSSWVSVSLGNVSMSTTSAKFFRFTVTGKNTSSSSYQIFPDYIDFTKVP